MPRFDARQLEALLLQELIRHGAVAESGRHVAASTVQTSLRGIDSHGINLIPHYCRAVAAGRVNGAPAMTVETMAPSVAILDADHGFGHHAGAVAIENAIQLANETGIGAVSVRNSTHFGAAAYFALMAAERNCLGFAFTNADALVKAFGAREAFCGTNPVCFTAPLLDEGPFCLDMATSLVSWNKINNYRRENMALPEGWAFDEDGIGVTDPHAARTLNPAGEYKGFGLGMMVDILCALLASGPISREIPAMYAPPVDASKRYLSHFFMAVDVARFVDPLVFRRRLQEMVDAVRKLSPLDPVQGVMAAGDPEKKTFAERSRLGIPVDEAKYEEFLSISPLFAEAVKQ